LVLGFSIAATHPDTSALGIDYTKAYGDDPSGRGFYLTPAKQGVDFKPIQEAWA
jgi:hypothetical protein